MRKVRKLTLGISEQVMDMTVEAQKVIFGQYDSYVKLIEKSLNVTVIIRDGQVKLIGLESNVNKAKSIFGTLESLVNKGSDISVQSIEYALALGMDNKEESLVKLDSDLICHTINGKPVKPKTLGQKSYVDSIRNKMIVFGVGPAGTGKTYLAMAMAVTAFKKDEVNRIILTRPAIEAGEKLGFLPGDMQSKVDPYLRPLYDALNQIMGPEVYARNFEKGLIEVAPLAYMRGRTLDNAFIILDEAQNTTPAQMKMFLTRIGFGSKVVITGDVTQKDLPKGQASGLDVAMKVLADIDDIGFCHLSGLDVVRHPLVRKIVKAYDDYDEKHKTNNGEKKEYKKEYGKSFSDRKRTIIKKGEYRR